MRGLLLAALVLLVAGCTAEAPGPAASSTSSAAPESAGTTANEVPPGFDQALHDELMAMLERDQSGRSGGPDAEGDVARTDRLKEILAEHGWPTYDLVGEDG